MADEGTRKPAGIAGENLLDGRKYDDSAALDELRRNRKSLSYNNQGPANQQGHQGSFPAAQSIRPPHYMPDMTGPLPLSVSMSFYLPGQNYQGRGHHGPVPPMTIIPPSYAGMGHGQGRGLPPQVAGHPDHQTHQAPPGPQQMAVSSSPDHPPGQNHQARGGRGPQTRMAIPLAPHGFQNHQGYFPNLPPQMEPMQQAPMFTNLNQASIMNNINCLSNPLSWSGMKNVRDSDIEGVLNENWNTPLVVVGWSPHRKPVVSLENDAFIRSTTEDHWRSAGDVIFFCSGRRVVRCHGLLLHSILPEFTEELLHMATYQYNACTRSVDLPYIPICVTGVDQRCIEHLITLIFRGVTCLTGKETHQLLQVLTLLRIHELVVCIAPTPGNNSHPEWSNPAGVNTTDSTSTNNPMPPMPPPYTSFQQQAVKLNAVELPESNGRQQTQQGNFNKMEKSRFGNSGVNEVNRKKCKRTVHPEGLREKALALLHDGITVSDVAKMLNLSLNTIRWWKCDDKKFGSKPRMVLYPKELRNQALAALNDGKRNREVAKTLFVPSKVIKQWKYQAKKAKRDGVGVVVPASGGNSNEIPSVQSVDMNEIIGKNSLSFDYDGGRVDGENMPNTSLNAVKSEPVDNYDGTRTMFQEAHHDMNSINLFNMDKQDSLMQHDDSQTGDGSGQ